MSNTETIFALSSAAGRAGVAVFRISGVNALPALHKLSGKDAFPPRQMNFCHFLNPMGGAIIDSGMAVYFKAPASFTGEDVVEIHSHGGRAVINSMLTALGELPGLRHAEAGEFTRRAFINGKLDLLQAEAINDLIEADTESQRKQAIKQAKGDISRTHAIWREKLIEARALIEACIDFPDEDIPPHVLADAKAATLDIIKEVEQAISHKPVGERIRDGIKIAITGATNVGKSSLLNYLAARDVAIVSDIAGTTRDVIEVEMDINGIAAIIYDTAGIRETIDPIEQEGVSRARRISASADLKIQLHDATLPQSEPEEGAWQIFNMADRLPAIPSNGNLYISVKHAINLDEFMEGLKKRVAELADTSEPVLITRARHRQALELALPKLRASLEAGKPLELKAEDLRLAGEYMAAITGNIVNDELLGEIFGRFCIGK